MMVPDACGLSRALFRSQRSKLHEYSGEAMSYQVFQDWSALNIGSAILPKSKVTDNERAAFSINGKGVKVTIAFEAIWLKEKARPLHLVASDRHLQKVVPGAIGYLFVSRLFAPVYHRWCPLRWRPL